MTNNTLTRLNHAAMVIALGLAPAVKNGAKVEGKKKLTFREEIRQTITCKEMQPQLQLSVDVNLKNVCKTKEQIEHLTDKVVANLLDLGIKG